ncbi:4'-phosphopantetheinyl transferase superfamily protein [Streptomyces sp. WMMC500]|uniref:4'-phosphopantetheinyl transferase family protein n=1 Tax=Streptomyces sp. WMMC500 TaxID=3015154 RepID=UPI00248B81D6|nr:4'-phosphopantetheinyl transferase superfamily protein [Streptomyces sp. WMMC500]WBB61538.1 4'-phosphopantetheinyl transferase superfamily protein [Streptomyces sp. WMMC500]
MSGKAAGGAAGGGAVRVWDVDLSGDAGAAGPATGLLTDAERARAARLADPVRRTALLRSHAAARRLLAEHLGLPPERIGWTPGPYGKPALTGAGRGCEWNLSRSGLRALVAVGGAAPVGVDLQAEHPHGDPLALARRFFAPAEATQLAALPPGRARVRRLCLLLARKEARAKAVGGRLLDFLRHDVGAAPAPDGGSRRPGGTGYAVADLAVGPGYAAAVATTGRPTGRIDYRSCDWRDLCVRN